MECGFVITFKALISLGSLSISEDLDQTGADVQFDIDQKPINGMHYVVIRGSPAQIHAAATLIMQKQENKVCKYEQKILKDECLLEKHGQ